MQHRRKVIVINMGNRYQINNLNINLLLKFYLRCCIGVIYNDFVEC